MQNFSRYFALSALALSSLSLLSLMQARAPKQHAEEHKTSAAKTVSVAPIRVLVAGGGPDLDNNQVAIESNVRYLNRILPPKTPRTVLFADGSKSSETVLFDKAEKLSRGEYLYQMIWENDGPRTVISTWRRAQLGSACDGASQKTDIEKSFGKLARDSRRNARPVLLYFTGHGSRNDANANDNFYDLWNSEQLSVRELSAQIARLPRKVPVNVVMVQCFSGSFANLIFEGGNSQNRVLERDIAGFFAATRDRVAAGCTSEVDEAEYHDFTSYFFAALAGRDRVGRKVSGADFNADGRVGMDEAFCYTIANDKSIDVPTSTSDIFLRRFVAKTGTSTRYWTVRNAASPAQKFALEKLSGELKLSGENRLAQAQRELKSGSQSFFGKVVSESEIERAKEKFETLRHDEREKLLRTLPNLKSENDALRERDRKTLTSQLERESNDARWNALRQAADEWQNLEGKKAQSESDAEVRQAHLLRFVLLHESVALRAKLMSSRNVALKNRFARLVRQEASTPLPPVS